MTFWGELKPIQLALRGVPNMSLAARGGVQQRLKRALEEVTCESQCAHYLIEEAVWGHLSMPVVQTIAAFVRNDVEAAMKRQDPTFQFESLRRRSPLGTNGSHVNHM